jgi:hypothetical protein
MRHSIVRLALALLLALPVSMTTAVADGPDGTGAASRVRLGTFDSRAVAVAYARSDTFASRLQGMRAELQEAKEAGDEDRASRLEAEGQSLQRQLHMQGFGTAPIDGILEQIRGDLPEIAREAGVDVIVSVWHLAYREDSAELVDVTDTIVERFAPDEQTRKIIRQLRDRPPVPAERLEH